MEEGGTWEEWREGRKGGRKEEWEGEGREKGGREDRGIEERRKGRREEGREERRRGRNDGKRGGRRKEKSRDGMMEEGGIDFFIKTNLIYYLHPYRVLPQCTHVFNYNIYGTTCTEAEIDVLTGETEILRTDILFDCGRRYAVPSYLVLYHERLFFAS